MKWWRGMAKEGLGPHIIVCQAVVSCGHPCFDHGTCIMTSAEEQWCCAAKEVSPLGTDLYPTTFLS